MRTLKASELIPKIKEMILQANFDLSDVMLEKLQMSKTEESSEMGHFVLGEILENAEIAKTEKMPLCQDTGVSVFFIRWGQECVLEEMTLQEMIDQAVREAYSEGYLRKSILKDPLFDRSNSGDNTPAVLHLESIPGDQVEIQFLPKGAGADNCSQLTMLRPADGLQGVKDFVIKVCKEAGASSCPPWILGVGVGGTFDTVASLAKHAILREVGSSHEDPKYAALEQELMTEVNALGIGPQGLGGKTTALAVHIEARPVHAASLPVAVNIQCHSNRSGKLHV